MPYLTEERKKFIEENPNKTFEPGDWNYLFTLAIIAVWEKTPKYQTIHKLYKACFFDLSLMPEIKAVETKLATINVDRYDVKVARELAFNEFMRRIGNNYEELKCSQNGDVYPQPKAFTIDELQKAANKHLGTESTGLVKRPKKEKK